MDRSKNLVNKGFFSLSELPSPRGIWPGINNLPYFLIGFLIYRLGDHLFYTLSTFHLFSSGRLGSWRERSIQSSWEPYSSALGWQEFRWRGGPALNSAARIFLCFGEQPCSGTGRKTDLEKRAQEAKENPKNAGSWMPKKRTSRLQRSPWHWYLGDSHSTGERETNDEGMGEHRWPRLVGDVVRSDTWRNVAMEERTPTSWEGKGLKIRLFLARRDLHVLKGRWKKPVQKNLVTQRRTTYLGARSGTAVTKRRAHSRTLINVRWWAGDTVCTG